MNIIVRIKIRIESDIRIKLAILKKEIYKERKILYFLYVYNVVMFRYVIYKVLVLCSYCMLILYCIGLYFCIV